VTTKASELGLQHVTIADNEFHGSINACLRALANDMSLNLSVANNIDAQGNDLNHPLIIDAGNPDTDNSAQISMIRGLSDSLAMMHLYHDATTHQTLAPKDPVADRLFTLLEKERFEAVGSNIYTGVARNLTRAWVLGHSEGALSRYGSAEQLEFVLSCLIREQLMPHPLPPFVSRHLASIRGPVEDLVRDQLNSLPRYLDQQTDYGQCVLKIIERLGFDVTPKTISVADTPADKDPDCTPSADDNESDDFNEDDVLALRPLEKGELNTIDGDAEPEQVFALVRNTEHEHAREAESPRVDDIVEVRSVAKNAQIDAPINNYRVFNDTQDEVCAATQLASLSTLKQFRESLDQHIREFEPLIVPLANRLQRVLLSRQKNQWMHDRDEGELDPKRLTRIIAGSLSPLAFRERTDDFIRDTTVTLLIDNSRSMSGTPMMTAAACADLITRVLERCGVSTEVLGFTTVSMYGGQVAQKWRAAGCPANVGRINAVRHIVYKSADHTWRQSRMNFGLMLNRDILNQNIDGEALIWASSRMRSRPETRQILIVLTDGRPSDSSTHKANAKTLLTDHLKQVIGVIEQRRTLELIGIGIGHDVSGYYGQSIRVDAIEQLGSVLLTELMRLLKQ